MRPPRPIRPGFRPIRRPFIRSSFVNWWGWSRPDYIEWRGEVDDTVYVYFRGHEVWSEEVHGRHVFDEGWRHGRPLPRLSVHVRLGRVEGRGHVWIEEQPRPHNDFTAIVGIHDPQRGADFYRFVLDW